MLLDGYAVARWAAFAATLVVIGAVGFGRLLAASRDLPVDTLAAARRRAGAVVILAAVVLLLAAWARLNGQARTFLEPDEPVSREMLELVLGTAWGFGWKVQGAIAAGVGLLVLVFRQAAVHPAFALVALALAVATPLTGHAVGGEMSPAVALPVHAAHLAGLGLWLGTLTLVATALIPVARRRAPVEAASTVGEVIGNFTPFGLVGALVAAGTGVFLGWNYTGPIITILQDAYGRTLLLKLGGFALIVVLGGLNWRVIGPRVQASRLGAIRGAIWLELLLGLAVLGVTAVLVSMAAPGL